MTCQSKSGRWFGCVFLSACIAILVIEGVDGFVPMPKGSLLTTRSNEQQRAPSRTFEANNEEEEVEDLQEELNKLTEQTPMFASFDAERLEGNALPVPTFTAAIVLIGSLVWTVYLYDVGLNGF